MENEKFTLTEKNFRRINFVSKTKTITFTKFLPKNSESKFPFIHNFPTVQWEKMKYLLSLRKIPSNQLLTYLVISFAKTLLSRNFCQKRVRVNFHDGLWSQISIIFTKISWNQSSFHFLQLRYSCLICFHEKIASLPVLYLCSSYLHKEIAIFSN